MRRFLLFLASLFCVLAAANGQFLTGFVKDTAGASIIGAKIQQIGNDHRDWTDTYGAFHFIADTSASDTILITRKGYLPGTIVLRDSSSLFYNIVLIADSHALLDQETATSLENGLERPYGTKETWGFRFSYVGVGYAKNDFEGFSDFLGAQRVDSLNATQLLIEWETGFFRRNINWGFTAGFGGNLATSIDSLEMDYGLFRFGTYAGYAIVNSKRLTLGPRAGLYWSRHRIEMFSSSSKLTLEEYLAKREFDWRMHQFTAFLGLHVAYKVQFRPGDYDSSNTYFSIGGYVGASRQLDTGSHFRTANQKISSEAFPQVETLSFGVSIQLNVPGSIKNRKHPKGWL